MPILVPTYSSFINKYMMISYDAWHVPTLEDFHFEWESEWDKMRYFLNTSFFDDAGRFVKFMANPNNYKIIRLSKELDSRISRRTHCSRISELEMLVSSYRSAARRKGVPTRLAQMMQDGAALPMPYIIKHGRAITVAGGNTRLDVARILDITPDPQVLYYDLGTPEISDMIDQFPLTRNSDIF